MTLAKNYKCFQCGSTLGQVEYVNGILKHHCFICCAGDWNMLPCEVEGLNIEEVRELSGREPGLAGQILVRISIPGRRPSTLQTKMETIFEREERLTIHEHDLIKLK